ncbi:N-acetylmannosamine kinase [Vibrio ishigakensis]|uniref:N-acetylmannosamine kinase n=1 Tax=Vibrio ishigakensis TaxID=1481914 RepID=A0A0B8Q9Z6_9VIBR|nr:N-acetylmannosamine kinase [Vibrio ishigakensis]
MYLGVDIGGSSIKLAVMDSSGAIISKESVPSPKSDLDEFFASISSYVCQQREAYSLQGIAVSTCGAVNSEEGVIYGSSALPYLHGPNIKQMFIDRFGLPCELENDAHCAALGELWQGGAKKSNDCCLVVIGSGIGGSVVLDRRITHGHQLHRGEFGYMIASYGNGKSKTFSDVASTRG